MPLDLLPVAGVTDADGSVCCTPASSPVIGLEDAEGVARSLKALADPARLRLMSIIAAHPGSEACVCDLTEPVGLSQPTVSHHLKVLAEAGLVTRDKRGVWAYYAVVPGAVSVLVRHLARHVGGTAAD